MVRIHSPRPLNPKNSGKYDRPWSSRRATAASSFSALRHGSSVAKMTTSGHTEVMKAVRIAELKARLSDTCAPCAAVRRLPYRSGDAHR